MKEFLKSMLPADKKQRYLFVGLIMIAFVIGWTMNGDPPVHQSVADASPATTWTCSMHPQIQQPEPGQCPLCGMGLIPVQREKSDETGYREIYLSARARKLANIQVAPVERKFVETEIRTAMTDLALASREPAPLPRGCAQPVRGGRGAIHRIERVERKQVLQVGEDELLMLLLVMQAELDQRVEVRCDTALDQPQHALVDIGAICAHFLERRPREQAALRSRMTRPDCDVV